MLDKVMNTAKKLRKVAKKVDAEVADLIVDLNLHLVDLKLEVAETREAHRELESKLEQLAGAQKTGEPSHNGDQRAPVTSPNVTSTSPSTSADWRPGG